MFRRLLPLLLVMLVAAGWAPPLQAQWGYEVGIRSATDSNPLGLNGTDQSLVSAVEASLYRDGRRLSLGYTGTYTSYARLGTYDYYWHQAVAAVGDDTTGVSVFFDQRLPVRNTTYGYLHTGVSGGHVVSRGNTSLEVEGTGELYRFATLEERNQWNTSAAVRLSHWFMSGTTLMLSVGGGYTWYPSLKSGITAHLEGTASASRLSGGLRLARSLSPNTGVAVYGRGQWIGAKKLRPFATPSVISYAILDDPSIYNARTLGAEVTHVFSRARVEAKAGVALSDRRYIAQGTYLAPAVYVPGDRREDMARSLFATVRRSFRPAWLRGHFLDLETTFQWTDNDSNSYWYRYSDTSLMLGLTYRL